MKEGQLQFLPGRSGETCRVGGQACLDPGPYHSLSWPGPWKRAGSSWPFRPILGSIRAERHETSQVHLMRDKPSTYSRLLDQRFKRRRFLEMLTSGDPESLRAPRSAALHKNFPFIPLPTRPVVMALLSSSPCLWSSHNPGSFAEFFSFYQRHLFSNYKWVSNATKREKIWKSTKRNKTRKITRSFSNFRLLLYLLAGLAQAFLVLWTYWNLGPSCSI